MSVFCYLSFDAIENPSKLSIPSDWQSKEEKKLGLYYWLDEKISGYLDHFVFGSSEVSTVVEHTGGKT